MNSPKLRLEKWPRSGGGAGGICSRYGPTASRRVRTKVAGVSVACSARAAHTTGYRAVRSEERRRAPTRCVEVVSHGVAYRRSARIPSNWCSLQRARARLSASTSPPCDRVSRALDSCVAHNTTACRHMHEGQRSIGHGIRSAWTASTDALRSVIGLGAENPHDAGSDLELDLEDDSLLKRRHSAALSIADAWRSRRMPPLLVRRPTVRTHEHEQPLLSMRSSNWVDGGLVHIDGDLLPSAAKFRFLSEEFYLARAATFLSYNPRRWAATVALTITRFSVVPWALITALSVFLQVSSHELPRAHTSSHELPRAPTSSHDLPRPPTTSHDLPRPPTTSLVMALLPSPAQRLRPQLISTDLH